MVVAEIDTAQRLLCREQNAQFLAAHGDSKLGFALSTDGRSPANGLRHPAIGDTSGWYIWFGEEFSTDPNFFVPPHVSHLYDNHPELARLLGLAPGYRFLLAGTYLEVWFDPNLLDV
jgi:hypothetical protein